MKNSKSIHNLVLSDFNDGIIWKSTKFDVENGIDILVAPVSNYDLKNLNENEIWVRINSEASDGTRFQGIGIFDSENFILSNYSFLINENWVSLIVADAPQFVLAKEGPETFAAKMGKTITEVFPIKMKADVKSSDLVIQLVSLK